MRRTGKSSLLKLIADDMTKTLGRKESSFLHLNFESLTNRHLCDSLALHEYISSAVKQSSDRLTVLLDEIQNVESWEKCVNSLRADNACDIFITGSNSQILSGELATHLASRTIQFKVFPFSFAEYCRARRTLYNFRSEELTDHVLWEEYLVRGGMPGHLNYQDVNSALQYLGDIYDTIILKDIAQRWKIRRVAVLERVYQYLAREIGHRVSAGNIEKFLKSEKLELSRDTLLEFIRAGTETFALERLETHDLQGKQVLHFQPKLYMSDHGFQEALFTGSNGQNIDQVLENIVCIELLRRGHSVTVGDIDGKEIDFIAERNGQRMYIQVSYLLASEDTIQREFTPLLDVRDNWPKLVLSLDPVNRSQLGIEHKNIIDFLLDR